MGYPMMNDKEFQRGNLLWSILWFLIALLGVGVLITLLVLLPWVFIGIVLGVAVLFALTIAFIGIYTAVEKFRTETHYKD